VNARTRKVLEDALELGTAERGELARELLESLRDDGADDAREAWAEQIAHRAQQVLDGTAPTRDLDEALNELAATAHRSGR